MSLTSRDEIVSSLQRSKASATNLQHSSLDQRVEALTATFRSMMDSQTPEGQSLRNACAQTSGLHPLMIEWALRTSLPDRESLDKAAADLQLPASTSTEDGRVMAIVLAGNVFTAAIRAVVFPILAGIPIILKASSRDNSLPAALCDAWAQAWPEAGDALQCQSPPRGHSEALDLLLREADIVSVYGSDETIQEMRALRPKGNRFIGHGHGLGLIYVPASALENEASVHRAAMEIALDTIAYDQRGCLSPHSVLIQATDPTSAQNFALVALPKALDELSLRLPKGEIPEPAAAAQLQWRGVAAAMGQITERTSFAVSFEPKAQLRPSPGWRNLQTVTVKDLCHATEMMLPLGSHLKTLGVAGDEKLRRHVAAALPPDLMPRVCLVGQMQTPPLNSLQDGLSPWHALL